MTHPLTVRWLAGWEIFLRRVLYQWSGVKGIGVWLMFSAATALVSALWIVLSHMMMLPPAGEAIPQDGLWNIVLSYAVLFFLLNAATSLVYVTLLTLFVLWMAKWGFMQPVAFAPAWRLLMVTGIIPLAIVLVLGPILRMTFLFALLLMLVHALWVRTLDIPPPPEPEH